MKTAKNGFTLIELLVVIAIIGILSGIVLSSLSSARSRANDSAIKSNLNSVRNSAESLASGNNGQYIVNRSGTGVVNAANNCIPHAAYDSILGGRPDATINVNAYSAGDLQVANTIASAINAAKKASGKTDSTTNFRCAISGQGNSYLVAIKLSTDEWWCVDSSGYAGVGTHSKLLGTWGNVNITPWNSASDNNITCR